MGRSSALALFAGIALTIGAGCDDDEDRGLSDAGEVEAVVEEWNQAFGTGDVAAMCRLLSPELIAGQGSPEDGVSDPQGCIFTLRDFRGIRGATRARVTEVQIDGDSATADVGGREPIELEQVDGRWYIADPLLAELLS